MDLKQIITCLSIGMMSFSMADSAFATAPAEGVEAAKQGKAITHSVSFDLRREMKDGELIIPEEYTVIDECAFLMGDDIKKIDLKNVQSIEISGFRRCTALNEIDFKNVQSIGGFAFEGCTSLNKIDFKNVQSIGTLAFDGCTGLTKIDFRNVQSIGKLAFTDCTSLESITIPDSVISIGDSAFFKCTNLKSVNVYSNRVKQLLIASESGIDESIIHVIKKEQTAPRELTMQEKYATELEEIEHLKSLLRKEKGGEKFADLVDVKSDLHLDNDEVYFKQLEELKARLLEQLEKKNKK